MRAKAIPMTAAQAAAIHTAAHTAGLASAEACIPTPMTVQHRANPFDDRSEVTKQWHVPEGMCGFGWVEVRPSRGGFATYARDNGIGRYSEYEKCCMIRSALRTQSYERNMAYATGYANVLLAAGIDAYANGRVD